MMKTNYKVRLYILNLKEKLKGCLLKLGCHFFSSWYFIKGDCICTTGKVLKLNNIYTYKENGYVDIVRLVDVHIERGSLYCSLFFFSKNKNITVCHSLLKKTYIIWHIMDNKEFDEIMSKRLWQKVHRQDELWEFV
ncbi:MAG: hypothetical protein MUC93_07760 [Bacteroidales bacterium]|nr:hypothetical protein [Bacteroidales bacterium]